MMLRSGVLTSNVMGGVLFFLSPKGGRGRECKKSVPKCYFEPVDTHFVNTFCSHSKLLTMNCDLLSCSATAKGNVMEAEVPPYWPTKQALSWKLDGKLGIAAHGCMWYIYFCCRFIYRRVHGRFYGLIGIWSSAGNF